MPKARYTQLPKPVQTPDTTVHEAWEMRWQLPSPTVAATFMDALVTKGDESGGAALEGLPDNTDDERSSTWTSTELQTAHVAVGPVSIPSVAFPASLVAEFGPSLQAAVGAHTLCLSAGVSVFAVDSTVVKVFVSGPQSANVLPALHSLATAAAAGCGCVPAATGAG